MKLITLHLPEPMIKSIDKLVPKFYPNRAEAIRNACKDLLNLHEQHLKGSLE